MSTQLIKTNDLQKLLKYKESLQSWVDIVQRTLSLELTISLELQFKGNANSLNIVIATVVNNIIFITTIIIIIIIITKYKNGTSGRKVASVGEQSRPSKMAQIWFCFWHYLRVEFVGYLFCYNKFFQEYSSFPLPKPTFSILLGLTSILFWFYGLPDK